MKKIKYLLSVMLVIFCCNVSAKEIVGDACLGVLTMLTVDLNNDPVDNGYLVYEIPEPSEEIYGFMNGRTICNVYGPGQPYLTKESGVVKLHLRKKMILMESMDQDCQMFIEVPVNKYMFSGIQCYYYIQLNVTYNIIQQ